MDSPSPTVIAFVAGMACSTILWMGAYVWHYLYNHPPVKHRSRATTMFGEED